MRNTRWELNPYSFYDTEGLARHFERMAAEGWAPDRVGTFIRYRRIEPKKLRFAITYYPDDDGRASEGEQTFLDYCEQAGWKQAVGWGPLTFWGGGREGEGGAYGGRSRHVFCTSDAHAVAIDTDPALQVQTMDRALASYRRWLLIFLIYMCLQLWDNLSALLSGALDKLVYGSSLHLLLLELVVAVVCAAQLIGYRRWHSRAERIAEEKDVFYAPRSRPWLQTAGRLALMLNLYGVIAASLLGAGSSASGRLYLGALVCGIGPFAAALFVNASMERAGTGRVKRRAVTLLAAAAVLLGSTGGMLAMKQNGLLDSEEAPQELYDEGFRATIYHDTLPLYLSDLGVEDENARWSCRSWEQSSLFAAQHGGEQDDVLASFDDPEHPETARGNGAWIRYTVSDVYLTSVFDRCLASELDYHQTALIGGEHRQLPYAYRGTDAAPWGAERAWRLYDEEEEKWLDRWLLVRGTRIVEFLCHDLAMDSAQMAVVGEKLLQSKA